MYSVLILIVFVNLVIAVVVGIFIVNFLIVKCFSDM